VGSLRPGCFPGPVIRAANDAAPAAFESDTPILRNSNVLQKKSSKHVAAIVGFERLYRGESVSMLEG
jgi:hypothetical protein